MGMPWTLHNKDLFNHLRNHQQAIDYNKQVKWNYKVEKMLAIKKIILKAIVRGSDRRQKKMDSFWKFKISLEEKLEKVLSESVLRGIEDGGNNL